MIIEKRIELSAIPAALTYPPSALRREKGVEATEIERGDTRERSEGWDAYSGCRCGAGRRVITGYRLRVRTFIYLRLPTGNLA
jgi:hypothetical protein